MKSNAMGPNQPTTPSKLPSSKGLENAILAGIDAEFEKREFNGGGDTDARLRVLETDMAIVKEAMVTKEIFAREMGDIKTEVSKVPFETFKWLLGTAVAITFLILAIIKLIPVLETKKVIEENISIPKVTTKVDQQSEKK
ncbi:MAG: hypothetical protein HFP77_01065 [Methylococcales symbiont of Iophon sp. n. MRB-2018]|nr:MAG: hypothetical protein HFP77_01065 [Methylococcales symbiont of Iophon sp. n. MRB-2018]KAF3979436.1 MAG: hypothetical protein HFP76_07000 [Methylococcales symbiont of Iophon sp. n. MRB-2018]